MKVKELHPWDLKPQEARKIQEDLAVKVIRLDYFSNVQSVCGLDVSVSRGTACAACVVMSFPELEIIDCAVVLTPVAFLYIPGLLSFREIPALIPALEKLRVDPDILMIDGHGIAQPRRFGLASHLGLLCGKPSIGCAKSKLIGAHREPGERKGDWEYLYDGEEIIGAVLRTRDSTRPVIVSIGNLITLQSVINITLRCCTKYRINEPVRYAHRAAGSGSPY